MNMLKVLHIASIDVLRHMGPGKSVPALVHAINRHRTNAQLYNVSTNRLHDVLDDGTLNSGSSVSLSYAVSQNVDIVHFHGVFQRSYPSAGRLCRKFGVPYIICPRGSLVKLAVFRQSVIKKMLALGTVLLPWIVGAHAIHFLTEEEAFRSVRFGRQYFVSGNGVVADASTLSLDSIERREIVFVGRLDVFAKGLDRVITSVARSANTFREGGWKLVMYGPDHRGGKRDLERRIEFHEVGDIISVRDPVQGIDKQRILAGCLAFIHASRFEGQPQAVLEAMALKLPVIVSRGTNMHGSVLGNDMGVSFEDIESDGWEEPLSRLTNRCEVSRLGANGLRYVETYANWDIIGQDMCIRYRDLLRNRV